MRATVVIDLTHNRFDQIARRFPQAARELVLQTAMEIEARAKAAMAAGKSGHLYDNHQASAPGEAPAVDTGTLLNSLTSELEGPGTAVVYTNVEYASYLEYGTSRMAARPFLTPAVEAVRPAFLGACRDLEGRL
jgi:HK97 gp10 family phage protein